MVPAPGLRPPAPEPAEEEHVRAAPAGEGLLGLLAIRQSQSVDDALAELLRLRMSERQLLENFVPESRQVAAVRAEAALIEEFLRRTVSEELVLLEVRQDALRERLHRLDTELGRFGQLERRARGLAREVDAHEKRLELSAARLADARAVEQFDQERLGSVRVLDAATPPLEPAGLSLKLRLALGAFAGVVLGGALALFRQLALGT